MPTYKTLIDLDRDGFLCQGVSASDALNIVPTPVHLWLIGTTGHTGAETVTKTQGATIYGLYYYRVVTGTNVNAGMRFGDDGTIDDIAVLASTAYRFTFWIRGVSGYTGVPIIANCQDETAASVSNNATFTLTANWQQITINVTTIVGSEYLRMVVRKNNDATNITYDVAGCMLVAGTSTPTAFNAGDTSNAYDDISFYVNKAAWGNGMSDAYEQVAKPATMTLTLNNHNREFHPENLSAELLANPGDDFTFTGDNLDNWTMVGESGGDPEVSEVGADEGHGGTGTGFANFYKTTGTLYIYQNVATAGMRYRVVLDINRVDAGGIICYSNDTPISPTFRTTGVKSFVYTASGSTFAIVAIGGAVNVTIASCSVKQGGAYYGLNRGMLIGIRGSHDTVSNQQLYIGKIRNKRPSVGVYGEKQMVITCEDALAKLVNIEYEPPLQTEVTTDEPLTELFSNVVVPYPYMKSFWVLGTDGASTLGVDTVLADSSRFLTVDTGYTELPYVGDNSDTGGGVMANAFIRDVVAAEMGGRFFFNARTSFFTFHNRNRDILNETIFASLTHDDLEDGDYIDSEDVINSVMVNYQPREVGGEAVVIFTATNLPIAISPGETRIITARYRDPSLENARIGAQDGLIPVLGTDIKAGLTESGTGNSGGNLLGYSVEYKAQSAKITLVNNSTGRTIYVNTLQLKGTPIYTYDRQFVTVSDANSQVDNDAESKRLDLPLVGSESDATDYANNVLSRFKDPVSVYRSVTFIASKTTARMVNALSVDIGSRITLVDSYMGHDADYIVVGEKHELTAGGDHTHRATWILKPVSRQTFWVLGVTGKSELGSTTYLAF